jgi:hypothetical protein
MLFQNKYRHFIAVALLIGASSCGGEDGSTPSSATPAPNPSPTPSTTPTPASALAYAATFPEMPREVADLAPLINETSLTFGSGVPFNDLEYTMLDTNFIEGETAGFDTFLPVDPSTSSPGADRIVMVRGVNNVDIDRVYDAQDGDRIILGTAEIERPFFSRGADGIDNDYAVISALDYRAGYIQLHGSESDYELVLCNAADGCATDGYYLIHTAASDLDLIAFIFPCDDPPIPVSGNPPTTPDALCNASGALSLSDPNQFRFATPVSTDVALSSALIQFGTSGKDIVAGQAMDSAGNIYVVGQSDASFLTSQRGGNRIFVAQVRNDGTRGWTYELDLPEGALLWEGVADDTHLYVTGRTHGALPGFTSGGQWDSIILKLRLSDGAQVAANQFGNRGLDGYGNIILDDAGNVFVSGQGAPASATGTDPFHLVAKHRTSDLSAVWRNFIEPPTTGALVSEAWGGLFYRPGSTPGDGTLTAGGWLFGDSAGLAGGFLETYRSLNASSPQRTNGRIIASPQNQAEWVLDNVQDASGNVYAVGFTTGDLSGSHRGNGDAYIAKYDSALNLVAVRQIGTVQADAFRKLTIAPDGTLYAVGYTYGDFKGQNADPANETGDVLVVRFDQDLNQLTASQFGTPHEDRGYIDVLGGNIFVAGMTEAALVNENSGSFDAFVVRLDRNTLEVN